MGGVYAREDVPDFEAVVSLPMSGRGGVRGIRPPGLVLRGCEAEGPGLIWKVRAAELALSLPDGSFRSGDGCPFMADPFSSSSLTPSVS